MVEGDATGDICEDGSAVGIYGKKEIAAGIEGESSNASSVCERKGIRFVTVD